MATRGGGDTINGTATGLSGYGIIDYGYISLGSGNDFLISVGSFTGLEVNSGGALDAGSGSDSINGIANSTGFDHNATGIRMDGSITAGNGVDLIRGEARGVVPGNVSTGLEGGGILDGGNGNDIITGYGINDNGLGFGIRTYFDGSVSGGNGNDLIAGFGTTAGIGVTYGLDFEGPTIVDGGNGDDHLKARIVDPDGTATANQGGAVTNALILGGNGNDIFDVGYGNATLDGGRGFDSLLLPGSADDYCMQEHGEELTITRDNYVLKVLNIEIIDFIT